ncbi:MAG TPA: ComEC/Rec2 family competence protein [Rhizomicrobium sp.]|jgi:competence protein ComEC|nr:ComEC/Rec2 family competence protein [Rhizomicrobium sp.]
MAIAPSAVRTRFRDLSIGVAALALRVRNIPNHFGRSLLEERERWALWLPVAFGTGIAVYFALPAEPDRSLMIACLCWSLAALAGVHVFSQTFLRVCGVACAALLLGFCAAKFRSDFVAAPVLMHRLGPVELDGRVETAQLHGKGVRAVLAPLLIDGLSKMELPRRVRISFRRAGERLVPGTIVRVDAVLMPPPPPSAPGDYDFGRAAWFEGIGAVGYAFGAPDIIAPAPPPGIWGRAELSLQALRFRISARIHAILPGSTGAIAAALIAGDRGGISQDDEESLRDAGLAHVLAIAGLHMALVGLGLFWTVRALLALWPRLALTMPIKKWAALAALGGAAFYLAISGSATPAVRAFTMLAMMLLAILFDRPAFSMRSLAFAATILLVLQPETLIEPGFQMSFAAVASLIAVAEWEQRRSAARGQQPRRRFANVRHYARGIAVTSFVGSIATMPYAAFHFDRATHYAVLGNLLAMPIMGFITMPMAAVSVALMPIGLDAIPLHVMGLGIAAMLAVGRFVSHLPGAVTIVAAWPVEALVLISLGGLWTVIWRNHWRWLGFMPAIGGIAIILLARAPDLLVARDGQTIAIRAANGRLYFIGHIGDEYSASEWLKRDGDGRLAREAIAGEKEGVRCDALGCIAQTSGGLRVAAVRRSDALHEDCANAEIVISAIPTRGMCKAPHRVIDRVDIARNGAYALWFGRNVRLETVQDLRGLRPWSRAPWERRARRFNNGG